MGRTNVKFIGQVRLAPVVSYVVSGIVLVILPLVVPIYFESILTRILIFAIFALSLNLIWGYTGLISLGHAASFGVASYTIGILTVHYGIESFWLLAPAGILMATLVATVFGFIALRVSGVYFLLVTLALGQLVYAIATKWTSMTGGSNGLPGIPLPILGLPWFTWNATYFYYFVLVVFVICFFLLYRIVNSPFGHALEGIRDSEPRMRSLGYQAWLHKYIAFIVAGLFAGVAGILFAPFLGLIAPVYCSVTTSTLVMVMVLIGGKRVFFGPVIGTALIIILENFSSGFVPERWPLILGGAIVVSVMFLRGGISVYLVKFWEKVRYRYGGA